MKRYAKFIKILISFGILVYLLRLVDFNVLWEQFSDLNLIIFILAFLILFIQCVLSSLKWKIILTAENKEVPFLFLLKSYLTGNF
ncbi:MAG: lysylphosphatidylglycerol synthase domain-containing protein, partial [Nitrospinales bacterium]